MIDLCTETFCFCQVLSCKFKDLSIDNKINYRGSLEEISHKLKENIEYKPQDRGKTLQRESGLQFREGA